MRNIKRNIFPVFNIAITRKKKEKLLKQKGLVVWMAGLSGSGKSTLAIELEKQLHQEGFLTVLLDGDNLRTGINNNLGFSEDDRLENIRRMAEIARLFLNCGFIAICAAISPTKELRRMAKKIVSLKDFFEIYVNCPLTECEKRDKKGLYKKARKGQIKNFTGVNAPFEPPFRPDLELRTDQKNINECKNIILSGIYKRINV